MNQNGRVVTIRGRNIRIVIPQPPPQVNAPEDNRPIQVNVVSSTTKGPNEIGDFYFNLELSEPYSE